MGNKLVSNTPMARTLILILACGYIMLVAWLDSGSAIRLTFTQMVQFNAGVGRQDATCFGKPSLPHVDVGTSPSNSERYFSSGNERTHVQIDIKGAGTNAGYYVRPEDRFKFIVDLMNMNMEDKTVYLTMYYDLLPGKLPAGWKDVKPVWFDAAQCGTSEVSAKAQAGAYKVPSGVWKPNFDGEVIGVGGHLHDVSTFPQHSSLPTY